MIVYFNRKPVFGPWGGGTKVLSACVDAFRGSGHDVRFTLTPDVDVIFCFDPRPGPDHDQLDYASSVRFAADVAAKHGKRLKIIQRVGDLGTHSKPELFNLVLASVVVSDTVVYPSQWAMDVVLTAFNSMGIQQTKQWHVIRNAPASLFLTNRVIKSSIPDKVSFVTHHWSTNPAKGFDFYVQFREWCLNNGHTFTYIGRDPTSKLAAIGPLDINALASELVKHDVYVTASQAEAGANHVLEAVGVGMPVLYSRHGGSIVEYCRGFGVEFDGSVSSCAAAVDVLRGLYAQKSFNIARYRETITDVARAYVQVVEGLT